MLLYSRIVQEMDISQREEQSQQLPYSNEENFDP